MVDEAQVARSVQEAQVGEFVPVVETLDLGGACPVDYFAKLSDYGRNPDCVLLESADIVPKYGQHSMGTADPCLKLSGRGESFKISALNELGVKFIWFLRRNEDLGFCDEVEYSEDRVQGVLKPRRGMVSESDRLKLRNHMDIIRTLGFRFTPARGCAGNRGGLFGILAYDFIDQVEDLPPSARDDLQDPNYQVYYADNLFWCDHKTKRLELISNALMMNGDRKAITRRCLDKIVEYRDTLGAPLPAIDMREPVRGTLTTDMPEAEFCARVRELKEHILNGDVFQAVLSRDIAADFNAEPLEVYRELRRLNPSPYMFFVNDGEGILLGASPEMSVRVEKNGQGKRVVEIRPIAGTKPRGLVGGEIDRDLDARYEAELKLDPKELAEHVMLVDLARNDVARIAVPGTRFVDEPFVTERYSHVQHLVSNVSGELRREFDALHAYLASMNMGTLTGAPKVKAMELLRRYEKSRRGYYGGAVFYLTPEGNFDSAIVIRSMRLKGNKAHVRVGAGIVQDSIPEKEFDETQRKAGSCLRAIQNVGGIEYE